MPLGREHRFWWHISGAVSSGEQTGRSMGSELSVPTESPSVIQCFSGAQWPRPGTVSLGQGAAHFFHKGSSGMYSSFAVILSLGGTQLCQRESSHVQSVSEQVWLHSH